MNAIRDGARHSTRWTIHKYNDPDRIAHREAIAGLSPEEMSIEPYEVCHFEGNMLVDEGIAAIWDSIGSSEHQAPYNNGSAWLGVGSSNQAAAAGDTGLVGTDKDWASMAATYPIRTGTTMAWRGSFGGGTANFAWEEFCVINGTTDADPVGHMLNRKVSSQGTKAVAQTWTLTMTLGIS